MKRVSKNITFISALTLALLSQNTAFAQTVLVAEAPVVTRPIATSFAATAQRTQFTKTEALESEVIEIGTSTIKPAPKARWQSEAFGTSRAVDGAARKSLDNKRWLLKPEDTAKEPRNYAGEFAGLRPAVLGSNNVKVGTATQYIESNEQPYLKSNNTSSQNIYSKTDDNFLVRAKLDF